MNSIRYRLIGLILTTLLLGTGLIAGLTFHFVHEEFAEIMDGTLKQLAVSVSPDRERSAASEVSVHSSLQEEDEFLIQVWRDGVLTFSSHPEIPLALMSPGLGDAIVNGEGLRYYQQAKGPAVVQIAHSLDQRNEMEWEIVSHFIGPILVLLPVMIGLIYINIGIGLRPLMALSARVRERSAQNLTPIATAAIPVEILPLVESLNTLLRRLEQSIDVQRQFTADAAHELRTPLTAISLHVDMLPRATTAKERQELEQTLKQSVERATKLAASLLQLARHEADTLATSAEAVDLAAIGQAVTAQAEVIASAKGLALVMAPAEPAAVVGHAQNLSVMVENLLENALNYAATRVQVTVSADDSIAQITVADDGPGIPEAERHRVFDRFYRISGSAAPGSGLGLSIVKHIASSYGGTVAISCGLGGSGTAVTVSFPRALSS